MKFTSKDIAVIALFVAIIALMTFTPLGMIPLPILKLNLVLVPILVCSQLKSLKVAFFISTMFGTFSFINGFVNPSLLYFAVQNPLVSVLPRIFVGPFAHLVYVGLKKAMEKRKKAEEVQEGEFVYGEKFGSRLKKNLLPSVLSAAIGVMTNTLFFLGMVYLLYNGASLGGGTSITFPYIAGIVATNFIPELLLSVVSVPLIVSALEKALKNT